MWGSWAKIPGLPSSPGTDGGIALHLRRTSSLPGPHARLHAPASALEPPLSSLTHPGEDTASPKPPWHWRIVPALLRPVAHSSFFRPTS